MSGEPKKPQKLRSGGVMRCCIKTLEDALADGSLVDGKQGDLLPCKYCRSRLRFTDGAWEWDSEYMRER